MLVPHLVLAGSRDSCHCLCEGLDCHRSELTALCSKIIQAKRACALWLCYRFVSQPSPEDSTSSSLRSSAESLTLPHITKWRLLKLKTLAKHCLQTGRSWHQSLPTFNIHFGWGERKGSSLSNNGVTWAKLLLLSINTPIYSCSCSWLDLHNQPISLSSYVRPSSMHLAPQ